MLKLSKYVGLPYTLRGDTTHGLDCWGIIKHIYEQERGIKLPYLFIVDEWESVNIGSEPWDVIGLSDNENFYKHVVLYLGDGYALHADNEVNYTRIEKLDDIILRFNPKFLGGFRWKK